MYGHCLQAAPSEWFHDIIDERKSLFRAFKSQAMCKYIKRSFLSVLKHRQDHILRHKKSQLKIPSSDQ